MTVMRDAVVKAMVKVKAQCDGNGFMHTYGLMANHVPTSSWNLISERLMAAVPSDRREEVAGGLLRSATECAYHSAYGIITSDDFKTVIEPMITEGDKDMLRGIYAVVTAFGLTKSGLMKYEDGKSMTIRSIDYYEADSGGEGLRAYLVQGIGIALFELVCGGDYDKEKTEFKFRCEQTHGIENGDKYGEFVVTAG